jgi:hypothetical protein
MLATSKVPGHRRGFYHELVGFYCPATDSYFDSNIFMVWHTSSNGGLIVHAFKRRLRRQPNLLCCLLIPDSVDVPAVVTF